MDFNKTEKAANQKRNRTETETLSENDKIIKSHVEQNKAYWHSKKKMIQLKNKYKRAQQNIEIAQMNFEASFSQYQEELRLCTETLNKIPNTEQIIIELGDHETLQEILSVYKADMSTSGAYQEARQVVRESSEPGPSRTESEQPDSIVFNPVSDSNSGMEPERL